MSSYCQLWLTCKDATEASEIASKLLGKKLIACAKQIPTTSDYLWKGKIENNSEVLLLMESREDLFGQIEKEVAKLHSYDTFVLITTKMDKVSKKAKAWLSETLKTG